MRKMMTATAVGYQLTLLRNLTLFLGLLPTACLAAVQALVLDNHLQSVPFLVYLITTASAALGGLAGTLHRVSKHLEPEGQTIKHPKLFVAANMAGGLVAGWFTFLTATLSGAPTLLVQGLVLLASFGGAAVVERAIDKFFPSPSKA